MTLLQLIQDKANTLPPDKQQEVLDFIEFLQSKLTDSSSQSSNDQPLSFLEAASEFAGCLEGPGDLSSNPKYMEGFGR